MKAGFNHICSTAAPYYLSSNNNKLLLLEFLKLGKAK